MQTAPPEAYEVDESEDGLRLDTLLSRRTGLGRRGARRLAGEGRLNGRRARPGQPVGKGDTITMPPCDPRPADGGLAVLRKSAELIVLNKPAGIPTLALAGKNADSMAARLAAFEPGRTLPGPPLESGIVHRLDSRTSGVLLAARTEALWSALRGQTREHAWQKTYLCIVQGQLESAQVVRAAIGQHPKSRRRMRVVPDPSRWERYSARPATSTVEPLGFQGDQSLVRVRTRMGLRHQVRVHLASLGHPVSNDQLYGNVHAPELPGHYLHGESILWRPPEAVDPVKDSAPTPEWWPAWALDLLR